MQPILAREQIGALDVAHESASFERRKVTCQAFVHHVRLALSIVVVATVFVRL